MDRHIGRSSHINLSLLLVTLLFFSLEPCNEARVTPQEQTSTKLIKSSCGATKYPDLCFSSLSNYASTVPITSPTQLAQAALSVSLSGAQSASAAMSRLSSAGSLSSKAAGAARDCMDTLADSVYSLKESLAAMGRLKGKDTGFVINSIQTWVSAALTDDQTCMDGIAVAGVKKEVRSHVVNVARLTCNALALVGGLA